MNEESENKHRRSKVKRKTARLENKGHIKHGNLTLNEKAAIQKKIKSCKDES